MNKAIKYRLYPNEEQIILIEKTFGCVRKIWNLMLADRKEHYVNYHKTYKPQPAIYKDQFPFLREVDSLALCNAYLNLNEAYKQAYKDKKRGFPKFKCKKTAKKSYTTNNQSNSIALVDNEYIKLPKLGLVEANVYRKPKADWKLKSATVSKDTKGDYYVSILFEFEKDITPVSKESNKVIGLDYKSNGLFFSSENENCNMPHFFRKSQKKLAKFQRRLSKKKEKSNNYYKQLKKVQKLHVRIANQRKDFLHKKSTEIANQYDVVCVENLNMKAMSNKGFGNGKATLDNGYGMFLGMLEYKLNDRGKYFIKVEKWYPSSQICSNCGEIHTEMKDLSKRTLICNCGTIIDRDYNAALNIKKEGIRLLREQILALA